VVEYGVEDRIYENEEYSEKDVKMTGVIGNARSLLAKRTKLQPFSNETR